MLYNLILLFSSITAIYTKLNFELGYFKFNHKVFTISAYFINFKMFVSHFLKIIKFYPNCKPHMYAVRTYFCIKLKEQTRTIRVHSYRPLVDVNLQIHNLLIKVAVRAF